MTPTPQTFPVAIKRMPPKRIAFMRHIGPYTECGPVWQKFMGWAGMKGLIGHGTEFAGIGHDDPSATPPDKIRYDCCITVDDHVQAEGEVGISTLPGGEYGVLTVKGSYEQLPAAYQYLYGTWLPGSGRAPGDAPPIEYYRNSPMNTKSEDLLTEVCVLLR